MWTTVVIVGANGPVGMALIDELIAQRKCERIVPTSRTGKLGSKYTPPAGSTIKIEPAKLDIVDGPADALPNICKEAKCDVIFCCIGFEYTAMVWQRSWPVTGERLVAAAKLSGAPLIFMDNLYCFGPEGMSRMPLSESDTQFTTTTKAKKPLVRAKLTRFFLDAHASGECQLALVRASDFFGPRVHVSGLGMVWDTLAAKKPSVPYVIGDTTTRHAQAYVPDIARALVAVAERGPEAWGRAWHVPSVSDMSIDDWLARIRSENGLPAKAHGQGVSRLDSTFMKLLGFVVSPLKEMQEMLYAWSSDYTVSSADFEKAFPDFRVTPLDEAIQATQAYFKQLQDA